MDVLQQQANAVLEVLSRVQKAFGGHCLPAHLPAFAPPRDLENDVGRGTFHPSTPRVGVTHNCEPSGGADMTATAPGGERP